MSQQATGAERRGIDPKMTVHQILDAFPETLGVFNSYGIDSCCGGGVALEAAAERHGLDTAQVLADLRDAVK